MRDAANNGTASTTSADTDAIHTWMTQGTRFLRAQLDRLDDTDLAAPSRLPGWSRAQVLAHVARNAEALVNLLTWARTGIEIPMYASLSQRDADIEASAKQSPVALRRDVWRSADQLAHVVAELPQDAWSAPVRTVRGREIPASEVPWMRAREVWIHAVDLDAGGSFTDFPLPLVDTLLTEVATTFVKREERLALRLAPTDRIERWEINGHDPGATDISGTAPQLLAWLLGRDAGVTLQTEPTQDQLPRLPAWL